MTLLKKFAPFIILIILSYWAIAPLLHSGFFPMHDDEQIARLYDLNQTLHAGNIPPRIAPNLGFGYGYPFFNFYPPFAYYVGELFILMGFSYIISIKLMLATGFILASVFMYLFTKEFFGKLGGLVAAVAYTYASYHGVDVYVRGAFAEFFAFVFIPLIFWSIFKLKDSKNVYFFLIGALGVGGLILSHNLIALMSAPFFFVWLLYVLSIAKDKMKFFLHAGLLFLFGFWLTAYFWLPSYFEREYTLINILTSELADYSIHFVCVHQLWNSAWGYGGSIPGCFDGISFEIGKVQLLVSFGASVFAGIFLLKGKQKKQAVPILIFLGFLLLSAFLMVKYSKLLWDIFPPFWYIQFPWRFLLLTSFITAVLCGSIIGFIKNKRLQVIVSSIVIAFLIGLNIFRFTPERYLDVVDNDYINKEKIRWETSSLAYEYVPKGIATKKSKLNTTLVDINKNEIASSASQIIKGEMQVKTLLDLPQHKKFVVDVVSSGIFQINTFSFPGWAVYVDKGQASYSDANKLKLIQVPLQQGQHVVEAKFLDTPVRTTGNSISILSIIGLTVLSILAVSKRKHEKTT